MTIIAASKLRLFVVPEHMVRPVHGGRHEDPLIGGISWKIT